MCVVYVFSPCGRSKQYLYYYYKLNKNLCKTNKKRPKAAQST